MSSGITHLVITKNCAVVRSMQASGKFEALCFIRNSFGSGLPMWHVEKAMHTNLHRVEYTCDRTALTNCWFCCVYPYYCLVAVAPLKNVIGLDACSQIHSCTRYSTKSLAQCFNISMCVVRLDDGSVCALGHESLHQWSCCSLALLANCFNKGFRICWVGT